MVKLNANLFKLLGALLVVILICKSCGAVPKYEEQNTYPNNQWRRNYKENDTKADSSSVSDRAERLGFTTGYGSQGYPYSGSGVGVYSPLKIDLGGVVIGALIGIGALLIVPKFLSAFNGGYGGAGNYRSVDGDPSGLTEMLTKIDDILGKNNIDSTTCVQRAVCTYVRSAEYHMTMGTADQSDQIIHTLTGNALVEYMLDGTAIKEALENGKNMDARDCDTIYPGCPLDKQSSMQMLTKLLPKNGQ